MDPRRGLCAFDECHTHGPAARPGSGGAACAGAAVVARVPGPPMRRGAARDVGEGSGFGRVAGLLRCSEGRRPAPAGAFDDFGVDTALSHPRDHRVEAALASTSKMHASTCKLAGAGRGPTLFTSRLKKRNVRQSDTASRSMHAGSAVADFRAAAPAAAPAREDVRQQLARRTFPQAKSPVGETPGPCWAAGRHPNPAPARRQPGTRLPAGYRPQLPSRNPLGDRGRVTAQGFRGLAVTMEPCYGRRQLVMYSPLSPWHLCFLGGRWRRDAAPETQVSLQFAWNVLGSI